MIVAVDHDDHVLEVLGGRPDHRRASDIDVLEHPSDSLFPLPQGLGEGIKIDDHQVDPGKGEPLQLRLMLGGIFRQNRREHEWVERLDSSVEDFGETGDRGNFGHGNPAVEEVLGGSSGR